nr:branched-chain amino acid ABC transporter permease [Hippea alviniae]
MITGLIYSLVAIGFNIIYASTKIVNFAQGEFVMLGAMLEFYLLSIHIPIVISFLISILSVGILGYLIFSIFIKNTKSKNELTLIILTIGIAMTIRGTSMITFGKNAHPVRQFLPFESITVLGLSFSSQYLIIIFTTLILATLLFLFFSKTLQGKIAIAISENRVACEVFGIDSSKIQALSFFVSGVIGAIGGSIMAPILFAKYDMGLSIGLKGFAASVVGGFGNNIGALLGGLLIGVAESLSSGYISSSYRDIVAFSIMILTLFLMPQGLLGSKDVERV